MEVHKVVYLSSNHHPVFDQKVNLKLSTQSSAYIAMTKICFKATVIPISPSYVQMLSEICFKLFQMLQYPQLPTGSPMKPTR